MTSAAWQARPRAATAVMALLAAALWISASEYLKLRAGPDDAFAKIDRLATSQPWGGLAASEAAREVGRRWRQDPEEALAALDWHLARYPLDARRWLSRARIIDHLGGDSDSFGRNLAVARAIHPNSRDLNWQAVNLAQNFADADMIAEQLRFWLKGQPRATHQALFLSARWLPDPAERIDRVLPEGEDYLAEAMRYARVNAMPAMAEAVWQRLPQPRPDGDPALADYLRTLMADGDNASVARLRQGLDPDYSPGDLPGGHFDGNLAWLDAMGWELRMPEGASLRLEALAPDSLPAAMRSAGLNQALSLYFDGEHNLNLNAPRVRFSAPDAGRWRLEGWWQAEDLTTRTLPELHLWAVDDRRGRQVVPLPSRQFGWQPFSAEIELAQADQVLELRLVRRATRAFDQDLAGILRLAGLRFEPVQGRTHGQGDID